MTEDQKQLMEEFQQRKPELAVLMDEAKRRVLKRCMGKKVSKLQIREMALEELKAVEEEMKATYAR